MAAPKGSYNARRFHEERDRELKSRLSTALAAAGRSGHRFANVSALSAHLAGEIGQTAGNLRRNKACRAMLEAFLVNQKGAATLLASKLNDVDLLRVQLLQAQLDASNALRDRRRLELHVASLQQIDDAQPATDRPSKKDRKATTAPEDFRIAFECTAQALMAVIEHVGYLELNTTTKTLRDLAARPGSEPVSTPRHLEYYVEWLKSRPV